MDTVRYIQRGVIACLILISLTACQKAGFSSPEEIVQKTELPEADEIFEVSSGAELSAQNGDIVLSGTLGSPVETLTLEETPSTPASPKLATGFWAIWNNF